MSADDSSIDGKSLMFMCVGANGSSSSHELETRLRYEPADPRKLRNKWGQKMKRYIFPFQKVKTGLLVNRYKEQTREATISTLM